MAKARLITQGKILSMRTTREILWTVLKHKTVAMGVLRIKGSSAEIEGDICICNAIFVAGGKLLNRNDNGYNAIRTLLSLQEGTYQYLDYSDVDVPELDQGLKIRVTQLINKLPNLPVKLEELMGANTLNRIRSLESGELSSEEALIDKDTLAHLIALERRNTRVKAAALWGTFVAVSAMAFLLYFFQK